MHITGKFCTLELASTEVKGVTSYSLKQSADEVDTTSMSSSGFKSCEAGMESWSISAAGHWDSTDVKFDSDWCPGKTAAAELTLQEKTATPTVSKVYAGSVLVKSFDLDVKADGGVDYKLELTGRGVLTRPTVGA